MEPIEDLPDAFVEHGALDARLVYDTSQEMYSSTRISSPISPNSAADEPAQWLISVERLIDGSKAGRASIATMQKSLAAMAAMRSGAKHKR